MIKIKTYQKINFSGMKFIDLFAGIGGFHLALSSFNSECVFASEWDKHAQSVYEKNFGIKPFGDITLIEEKEIPPHVFAFIRSILQLLSSRRSAPYPDALRR